MNRLDRYLKDHYFNYGKNVITVEPKPTLSKIVKDGLQAMDDAVMGVITRHEAEIEALKKPKIDYEKLYKEQVAQQAEAQRRHFNAAAQGQAGLQGLGQAGAAAYGSVWDFARGYYQ